MSNIQWQDMHNVQQRAINTIRKKKAQEVCERHNVKL